MGLNLKNKFIFWSEELFWALSVNFNLVVRLARLLGDEILAAPIWSGEVQQSGEKLESCLFM